MAAPLIERARRPRNLLFAGVLFMLCGDFMFALNDAMGKWLLESFSVGQLLLIRSIGALVMLAPVVVHRGIGRLVEVDQPKLHALRVVLLTLETALFYAAVIYLPLADVMSFYMAGPIYVAALSHFMLGERIGWRRWSAILLGFVGVLIILQPSTASASSVGTIYAVLGSLFFALTIVLNRMLRATSDTTMVTWQMVGTLLFGGALSLFGWTAPSPAQAGLLLLLGIVACLAHMMITRALKLAPASTLAPLRYTLLLWAAVLGWAFFDDVPGPNVLAGSAVIVFAGLFIVHRQKVVDGVPKENVPHGVG